MGEIRYQVDDLDQQAIIRAIAAAQRHYRIGGQSVLSDGAGDLGGRLLGEICRDWIESHGYDRDQK